MIIGINGINGALDLFPIQPELVEQRYTNLNSAVIPALSAFGNVGFTITSDSLIGLSHNPLYYVIISILVVAGNTALSIILRYFITVLRWLNRWLVRKNFLR